MQERIFITHHLSFTIDLPEDGDSQVNRVFGEQNFADEEEDLNVTTIRFSEAMSLLMKYLKFLMRNPRSNKRCMYL